MTTYQPTSCIGVTVMSKQRVIDETQILQMHEGSVLAALHLWQDGLIDLDVSIDDEPHRIGPALQAFTDILDRSIRSRNQQIEDIENEPMDRFRRRQI